MVLWLDRLAVKANEGGARLSMQKHNLLAITLKVGVPKLRVHEMSELASPTHHPRCCHLGSHKVWESSL